MNECDRGCVYVCRVRASTRRAYGDRRRGSRGLCLACGPVAGAETAESVERAEVEKTRCDESVCVVMRE